MRGSVILVKAPWPFQVIDLYDYAKEETYRKSFAMTCGYATFALFLNDCVLVEVLLNEHVLH